MWFVWSIAFLGAWIVVFVVCPQQRKVMAWASVLTAPLGLTEPLFVPAYWSPPSLFNLARTTGFDIESLIFSFGIGGVGAVIYNLLTGRELTIVADAERHLAPPSLAWRGVDCALRDVPNSVFASVESDLSGHCGDADRRGWRCAVPT